MLTKRKFIKSIFFEKAVLNLQGSEWNLLLVMDRDLNPTAAPIGENPMVQFLISGCSTADSAGGLGPSGRRFKSCHPDQKSNYIGLFSFIYFKYFSKYLKESDKNA